MIVPGDAPMIPAPPALRLGHEPVDGILLLDKPLGMTSNQALQKVRRLFRAAKGGHTGSLDPLATGLLPICLGEATKIAGVVLGGRKAYRAEVTLGAVRRGDDLEGEVLATAPVPSLDRNAIEAVLARFRGDIRQVPPTHSALKRNGVPVYKLARRGVDVELAPRPVRIDALELLQRDGARLQLEVVCTSGTYIRALARDLGAAIGCGGHLSALRRLWCEPFTAPVMHALVELERLAELGDRAALLACLRPVAEGLVQLPAVFATPDEADAIRHGRAIASAQIGPCRVLVDGQLLALAEGRDGWLRVRRGFNLA